MIAKNIIKESVLTKGRPIKHIWNSIEYRTARFISENFASQTFGFDVTLMIKIAYNYD